VKSLIFVADMSLRRHVVKHAPIFLVLEPIPVYDITVEGDQCYYAEGYLVSNSDAIRMLALGLPKVTAGRTADDIDKAYRQAMFGEQQQLPKFFRDGI
jgi:hypothetical protein